MIWTSPNFASTAWAVLAQTSPQAATEPINANRLNVAFRIRTSSNPTFFMLVSVRTSKSVSHPGHDQLSLSGKGPPLEPLTHLSTSKIFGHNHPHTEADTTVRRYWTALLQMCSRFVIRRLDDSASLRSGDRAGLHRNQAGRHKLEDTFTRCVVVICPPKTLFRVAVSCRKLSCCERKPGRSTVSDRARFRRNYCALGATKKGPVNRALGLTPSGPDYRFQESPTRTTFVSRSALPLRTSLLAVRPVVYFSGSAYSIEPRS